MPAFVALSQVRTGDFAEDSGFVYWVMRLAAQNGVKCAVVGLIFKLCYMVLRVHLFGTRWPAS